MGTLLGRRGEPWRLPGWGKEVRPFETFAHLCEALASDAQDMTTSSPPSVSSHPCGLPFPTVTASHILNCSVHSWYPRHRTISPKTRLIPLPPAFVTYLRADGIVLPPEQPAADDDSGIYSDDEELDPSEAWHDTHIQIRQTISELGKVVPKLNWSAPKDATWISTTNDLVCTSANDVYLLLKSSDFITHDLEHPFDDCSDELPIPYHLVLRKAFNLNPALEFRCFVRDRKLVAISQREMNYFPFLFELRSKLQEQIMNFSVDFPDDSYTFDVYIPPPHDKVWLIDINPWAPRTDPLLFSWLEMLHKEELEFRLVEKDDPEAYQFASTKYSAHKLPKEVVTAGLDSSEGMRDLLEAWRRALDSQTDEDEENTDQTVSPS